MHDHSDANSFPDDTRPSMEEFNAQPTVVPSRLSILTTTLEPPKEEWEHDWRSWQHSPWSPRPNTGWGQGRTDTRLKNHNATLTEEKINTRLKNASTENYKELENKGVSRFG
jgi:hypothetical protein